MKFVILLAIFITGIGEFKYQGMSLLEKDFLTYGSIFKKYSNLGQQFIAWELNHIGEYESALKEFEENTKRGYDDKQVVVDRFVDAIEFIDSISKCNQAIFFNEAHHVSQHRMFVKTILPMLKANGYSHIGLESFSPSDTNITERGYPIKSSGFYIHDPVFSELLRTALSNDLIIFGYDGGVRGQSPKDREIVQAQNILKNVNFDYGDKVIILGGFDHIREDTFFSSWEKSMAGRFKEFSGINPVTFDQVQFAERFNLYNTNPLYKKYDKKRSMIPLVENGLFVNPYSKKSFDYYLFHPKSIYTSGVPKWKRMSTKRELKIVEYSYGSSEEYIVKAYYLSEYLEQNCTTTHLIPADISSVREGLNPPLILRPGKYYIEIVDGNGELVFTKTMEVKI